MKRPNGPAKKSPVRMPWCFLSDCPIKKSTCLCLGPFWEGYIFTERARFSDPNCSFDQGRFFGQCRVFGLIRIDVPGYGCCKKTACDPLPSVVLRCLGILVPCLYIPFKYCGKAPGPALYDPARHSAACCCPS